MRVSDRPGYLSDASQYAVSPGSCCTAGEALRLYSHFGKELLHEAIKLYGLFEIDGMSRAGHFRQPRMRDIALEHFHQSRRGDNVVLAHDQQRGSLQGTDLLGGRSRDCRLLAWRIESANLLIEKGLGWLLLRKVTRICARRWI